MSHTDLPLPTAVELKAGFDSEPYIRIYAQPKDTNSSGDIFGGWLLSLVDLAAAAIAENTARGRVTTVAIHEFKFLQPVKVGDLVSCYGRLSRVGNTSMTIDIRVLVIRPNLWDTPLHVCDSQLVYVAIDEHGKPRPIQPVVCAL